MLQHLRDKFIHRLVCGLWRETPFSVFNDSFDVLKVAALQAAMEAASYHSEHMPQARAFSSDVELLRFAFAQASVDGSVLEFGVASGRTVNFLASLTERDIDGFDCFKGLPEYWRPGFDPGHFAQPLPKVSRNVKLHVGLFDVSLADFLKENMEQVSLVHVDCDLYSSTHTIFSLLAPRITVGTVIVFDEYWNYPGWRAHEFRAFQEYTARCGVAYDYIGFVPKHQQVAVKIKSIGIISRSTESAGIAATAVR